MKKITTLFLLALLPLLASAYDAQVGGIYYNLIMKVKQAIVTSGDNKYTGSVTIPETITYNDVTYNVISIGKKAFSGCSGLTSVTIPNSVTSIGSDAFYDCSRLTSVKVPNSVTSIGSNAFFNTPWYKNQSDGLIYIGMVAYKYKGKMPNNTSIIIKDGTTTIGEYAFEYCYGLTSVTIPNSVTYIESYAFQNCSSLTSLAIPNSVTSIGMYAFSGCKGLTSVTIPNSVTSIGESAFAYCSGLTSVTIPNSVTSIGSYAFDNTPWYNNQSDGLIYIGMVAYKYKGTMPNNTSIIIKDGTTSIGGTAFEYCSGLTSVTIPNSVTSIGSQAFYKCSGLTAINIPNSVTSIGGNAFAYCHGLTSVTIPNSVTSIGNGAFSNCSGLTSLIIPNSVTSINRAAFHDCYRLTSVTCEATSVPATESDAFSNVSSATLYVPASALEDYKATAPWSGFGTIKAIGDVPVTEKCATPTISFVDGKLQFSCDTEDVEYVYNVTPPSYIAGTGTDISISTTYKVTVYATKKGYDNSDVATKEINVGGTDASGVRGDVNLDGEVGMPDAMFIVNKILKGKFPDE